MPRGVDPLAPHLKHLALPPRYLARLGADFTSDVRRKGSKFKIKA